MEPSKIFGAGNEECHSSESGWTTYIGSPIQDGDDDDDDDDDGHSEADHDAYGDETDANHEANSDDSMASDASSGPSHQGVQFYGNIKGGHGHGHSTSHFNHDEDEEESDYYLDTKAKKSVEKQKLIGKKKKEDKEEKEQMTFKAKGASTPSRSGSKGKHVSA
ncbi:hypothetical protein REPUB_Repub08aG0050500 [Reevesia pubescens]